MHMLTIFTPTFNRAEYLKKCYRSLVAQTNDNFVWQIIDDGSVDGTRELVNAFVKENKISIDYHWKENGGKASAINYSLNITNTPFWLCLDSDDYLYENAVETILSECHNIDLMSNVCGIFAVRSDRFGRPMKNIDVPSKVQYATQLDIRYRYNVLPEYVQVYKAEVIQKYRFPQFEGEKFVTESWMQDQIDQDYVFKIVHKPLMVCEYLPDGLTNNYYRLIRENPKGFLLFYAQRVKVCKRIRPKIIAAIMYNAVYQLIEDKTVQKEKGLLFRITSVAGMLMIKKIRD